MTIRGFSFQVLATVFAAGLYATSAQAAKYELDSAHTNVEFQVTHLKFAKVKGRFNKFSGDFDFDEKAKKVKDITVSIDAASIDTNNADRDKHLRDPDFFDVATKGNEKLTFKATEFKAEAGKDFTVKGDLTMRGQTRPVTLKGKFLGATVNPFTSQPKVAFELNGEINRKHWGLVWNKPLAKAGDFALSDQVQLMITAEADMAKTATTTTK